MVGWGCIKTIGLNVINLVGMSCVNFVARMNFTKRLSIVIICISFDTPWQNLMFEMLYFVNLNYFKQEILYRLVTTRGGSFYHLCTLGVRGQTCRPLRDHFLNFESISFARFCVACFQCESIQPYLKANLLLLTKKQWFVFKLGDLND